MLMLIWTSNTGYAQNSQTLIAKTKSPNYKHNFKHKIRRSARLGNDLDNSSRPSKDATTNPLKDRLKFELLTGGKWVTLDSSNPTIETTNQPLRVSYVPLKDSTKTAKVDLIFQKYTSKLNTENNKATLSFDLTPFLSLKNDDESSILSSEVISRLPDGMYGITIRPGNEIDFWLKVTAVPPEPPIISSIDTRLAEQGELSLKLKNIVVGDQIKLFVNGEPVKTVTIRKDSKLDSWLSFGKILPPGSATITAQLKRDKKESDYSSAVQATSRSTVIMARNTEMNLEDFKNKPKNSRDDERLKAVTEFEFVTSLYSKKKKKRGRMTAQELAQLLEAFKESLKKELKQDQDAQTQELQTQIKSLENKITSLQGLLTTQNQTNMNRDAAIQLKLDNLSNDFKVLKKCLKYEYSGWSDDPIFVWPSPDAIKDSYLNNLNQLTMHPLALLTSTIEKKYSAPIAKACNQTGQFTLDITFKAMDSNQATTELMRIVSFSESPQKRNFTLGQFKDQLVFRIRTNGTPPAMPNTLPDDQNGLGKTSGGAQGIHFFKGLTAGTNYNAVISFYDQKLHFWVTPQSPNDQLVKEVKYDHPISAWDNNYELILGNELAVTDGKRKWGGEIHSFSIRDRGVKLPRPDADCFQCLFSSVTPAAINTIAESLPSPQSSDTSDSGDFDLESSVSKTIAVKEFAFPFPASFPLPRYHYDGSPIETEGAVLDQMRLAIAKNGRYQLDFETRTTVRAEITLQLLVQLDNGQWYPLTIPKQTIVPTEYKRDQSESAKYAESKSIKGYAPILVNRSGEIREIRRRGNAIFGTPPYIN
tara:strand:- start:102425 stop:104869 length:2445 start_codon:yes stop_codon:yes gene_type:complete